MSAERPTVSPQLLAALIEATPDRVRRRLDREPDAASQWTWQANAEHWSIEAGGETVRLPHGVVLGLEQLACSCLLSPRCFHVLACVTRLEVALASSPSAEEPAVEAAAETQDVVELSDKARSAVRELEASVSQLLRVGLANAGLVVQSGLLRAVHQCRAEGLHRLANLGLRVATGTKEQRAHARTSDPNQLAEDVADLLETSRQILGQPTVPGFWVGTARRLQFPVRPRKLHGLFAEPVLTRSGFAGAAVYFLGEDDRLYTVSEVRPGNAQLARDGYLGGIEMGPLILPAKQLARGLFLGTDLTASEDGRLGRGKGVKIVEQGASSWSASSVQARFQRPPAEQRQAVYNQASVPLEARPAGWDFVFLAGTLLGLVGPELLLQTSVDGSIVRLAVENESESLCFRENLRMLGHAPGMRVNVIGRLNLQDSGVVAPLALGEGSPGEEPRLDLPARWGQRVCLGFDELQRRHLIGCQPGPVVLGSPPPAAETLDPLLALRRRWIASMLSGLGSQRQVNTRLLASEIAQMQRLGLKTAASLLDALARSPADTGLSTFLASAIYLRTCSLELARRQGESE